MPNPNGKNLQASTQTILNRLTIPPIRIPLTKSFLEILLLLKPEDPQPEGVSQSEGEHVPFLPSQEISPPQIDTPQIDESPEPNQATTLLPDPAPDPQDNESQQSDDDQDFIQPPPPPAPDPSNPNGLRRSTHQRSSPNDYVPQLGGKSYETSTFLTKIIDTAYAFAVKVTHAYAYAATQADPDTR